jgi:hypothetical protein
LTRDKFLSLAERLSIAFWAASVMAILVVVAFADDRATAARGILGGDFLAFYTAGEFTLRGEALAAYDQLRFDAALKESAPLEELGLMWQYPPIAFLFTGALALLPYKISYVAFMALGVVALYAALRHVGLEGRTLRLLVFSPITLLVIVSGQVSFITGALISLAAFAPKKRWLVAGLAAGLLTFKPQLGVLIPVAFLAVGAWRAIAVAAATGVALHALSLVLFGVDGWRAFFFAVNRLYADVAGSGFSTPPLNMTSLFGQLRALGFSADAAILAHQAAVVVIAAAIVRVWRSGADDLARAACLGAGATLASPYAYAYEMTALLLSGAYLGRFTFDGARLAPVGLGLALGWGATALGPVALKDQPILYPFLISVAALAASLAHAGRRDAGAALPAASTRPA